MRSLTAKDSGPARIGLVLLAFVVFGTGTVMAVNGLREALGPAGAGSHPWLAAPAVDFLRNFPVKQFVFFFGLAALLAVVLPATRNERFLGKSLAQDFTWFAYEQLLIVVIIATLVSWMKVAFDTHLGHLTTSALQAWPVWAKVAFGMVLFDFMFWVKHVLMHKVPFLWKFHKLHHSQREMNFFTNHRVHLVDHFTTQIFTLLPFFVLSFEIPQIYVIMVFWRWWPLLVHANVRTNLGPLRYVLVTPQSHRVHHSYAPEHHDRNYGGLLSVWDHLFGTQVRDYELYPETGLHESFPVEQDHKWWLVPFMPIWQTLYPFRELAAGRSSRRKEIPSEPAGANYSPDFDTRGLR